MVKKLDPEAVADGLGRPSVAELVALVHRVNPTGRGLPADEETRRYALKARLQSRLVRDWSAHLSFTLTEPEAGVVAIDHPGHGRDAAHVPLSALDPDARQIVLQALELPDEPVAPAPDRPRGPATAPSSALARGREALAAWDLELARGCFEEALAAEPTEPAAHALLSLFVEDLGQDDDALRVSLPDAALSRRVARLLALAAARTGDLGRARSLLRRLDGPAEAEIRTFFAERALADRDLALARTEIEALRSLDPAKTVVIRLQDAFGRLLAEGRAPHERALRAAVAEGAPERIRAAAQALLQAAPHHPGARAALEELEARERAAVVAARVHAAAVHEAAGRLDLALHELELARRLGAEVGEALDRLRGRVASERDRRSAQAAEDAIVRGDLHPYAALPEALRAVVRSRTADARLAMLDSLIRDRARDPVGALGLVEDAEAALAAGRPEAALAAWERVGPAGRQLQALERRIRQALVAAAHVRAHTLAERLMERISAGDDPGAATLADELRTQDLGEDRQGAEDAIRALRGRQKDAQEVTRFHQLVVQGKLWPARRIARERSADATDPAWLRRLAALEDRVTRIFPSRAVEPRSHLYDAGTVTPQRSPDACVEPDGRHAWLAECRRQFLWLRRIEVATSRMVSCTLVRTVQPLQEPRAAVFGDTVVVTTWSGRYLVARLHPDGGLVEVVWFADRPEVTNGAAGLDPGHHPSLYGVLRSLPRALAPGEAALDLGREHAIRQLTERSTTQRTLRHCFAVHPVLGPGGEARFVVLREDRTLDVIHGSTWRSERIGDAFRVNAVARCPTGDGVLCVGSQKAPEDWAVWQVDVPAPEGTTTRWRHPLPWPRDVTCPLAPSRALNVVFLLAEEGPGRSVLRAFAPDPWRPLWTAPVPGMVHLLTDPDGVHVVGVFHTRRGPVLQALGREPPRPVVDPVGRPVAGGVSRSEPRAEDEVPPTPGIAWRPAAAPAADRRLAELLDAADRQPDPEARFRGLDMFDVWADGGRQALGRLADAALGSAGLPHDQRVHAVMACLDAAWARRVDRGVPEPEGLARPWSEAELDAVEARAEVFVRAEEAAWGFLRYGPEDDPQWPPPELAHER